MKKILLTTAILALFFAGCDKKDPIVPNNPDTSTVTVPVTGVTLSQTTATVGTGQTLTLTATVLPDSATNKTVTWATSDPAVATVANGVVSGLTLGSTVITVTTADGNKTATCAVTVITPIPVTGITLDKTADTLYIGDTLRLIATIAPAIATNKTVNWMSTDHTVATVDNNGKVTPVSAGTTDIYAISAQNPEKTAFCTVTVGIPVSSITLNKTADTLVISQTLQLTATVLPTNAFDKTVTWMSSNPAVATVNNGNVTAVSAGTATITASTHTTQNGNKTATCTVTVNLGIVSFATTQTWTVGSQEWSDAVQTTGCSGKTSYNRYVDCRSNPNYKGDLFSWYAVDAWKDELCPSPWRVPTRQDFIDLDIALGGTGYDQYSTSQVNKYLNTWGGSYGGYCYSDGSLYNQGSEAYYWSQSEYSSTYEYYLRFNSSGYIYPQNYSYKSNGFTLRCVTTREIPLDITKAQVRFQKAKAYTYVDKMGVFSVEDGTITEELAKYYFGEDEGTSWYYGITPGYSTPLYYYTQTGYEGWRYCLNSPYTYNFQAGRKYTVVCSDDGQYLVFSVTDDGTFSSPGVSPSPMQNKGKGQTIKVANPPLRIDVK